MLLAPFLLTLQAVAPTLDGTITPGEYDSAARLTGSDSLVVDVRVTGDAIYLAASGASGGYPHLVVTRGDTVLLLHASAALGTAMFSGRTPAKSLIQPFEWAVRNAGASAAGDAIREQHYRRNGWTATTIEMGTPGVTEFKVSRSLLPTGAPLVVAFWSAAGVQHWPATTTDDGVAARMVQGFLPATATFATETWGRSP